MNFLFAAPDIDFDTQLTMEVLRELSQSLAYYYSWNVLCQLVYLFWLCFELVFCYIFIIETKNVCTNVRYRLVIPYSRHY
jgi:hypothetical protein